MEQIVNGQSKKVPSRIRLAVQEVIELREVSINKNIDVKRC